jgi:hypothetical protein
VSEHYFSEGAWASCGPLRLRSLTCLECGHRSPTWLHFLAHRRECRTQSQEAQGEDETEMTFLGVPADVLVFGIVLSACVCGALIAVGLIGLVVGTSLKEGDR